MLDDVWVAGADDDVDGRLVGVVALVDGAGAVVCAADVCGADVAGCDAGADDEPADDERAVEVLGADEVLADFLACVDEPCVPGADEAPDDDPICPRSGCAEFLRGRRLLAARRRHGR